MSCNDSEIWISEIILATLKLVAVEQSTFVLSTILERSSDYKKLYVYVTVDHRKFWTELRAVQDANGVVGHIGRATSDVSRPADYKARIQSNFAKSKNYRCGPRSFGHTGTADIQGKMFTLAQLR